jgi:hypothetical protein
VRVSHSIDEVLGFIVGTDGIGVDPAKIEVIKVWDPPTTERCVQSFLGMCNFYHGFTKDYSKIMYDCFPVRHGRDEILI